MPIRMPASPRQMWLARIGIVLALLAAVLMMWIARMDLVERTIQGETTTFTVPSWHSLVFLTPTLPMVIVGAVFMMQPGRIFKLFAALVISMAAMMIVGMLPTPFVHRAVLTPDRFDLRIGTWYSPREYSIRFDDVAYADIEDDVDNKSARTRQYVLECYLKRPDARRPVLLPICDLVKPALRQIVNALEKRGAVLGDPDHGLRIPPELAGTLR